MTCENQTSAAQKVKIALQLEQGGRVIGEYSSEDTLDKIEVKKTWHPKVLTRKAIITALTIIGSYLLGLCW